MINFDKKLLDKKVQILPAGQKNYCPGKFYFSGFPWRLNKIICALAKKKKKIKTEMLFSDINIKKPNANVMCKYVTFL